MHRTSRWRQPSTSWPHYCEQAANLGVTEIAVTEHTSRFGQVDALVRGWWDRDPNPVLRAETLAYWDGELGADLDQYVETALAARRAGLPVVVGLEVDYIPGQMDKVGVLLEGYPFDVLLGSVHWIGAWLINALDWADAQEQWTGRGVDRIWDSYTRSVEGTGGHPRSRRSRASRPREGGGLPPGCARGVSRADRGGCPRLRPGGGAELLGLAQGLRGGLPGP